MLGSAAFAPNPCSGGLQAAGETRLTQITLAAPSEEMAAIGDALSGVTEPMELARA